MAEKVREYATPRIPFHVDEASVGVHVAAFDETWVPAVLNHFLVEAGSVREDRGKALVVEVF